MKRSLLCLLPALVLLCSHQCEGAPKAIQVLGEADTNWPGIRYQVVGFKRIPNDRLLVSLLLFATEKAPVEGAFIGTRTAIPKDATKEDIENGVYGVAPFSLNSSVLIDEKSKQQYPALKPDSAGQQYRPSEVEATLRPGSFFPATVQFAVPPPPVDPDAAGKQTVFLQLANAKDPIKLTVPPADAASKPN